MRLFQGLAYGSAALALVLLTGGTVQTGQARTSEHVGDVSRGGVDQAGGVVKGVIKWGESQTPPRRPINMAADPFCAKAHDSTPLQETYVWGEGGDTLANVFVYISKAPDAALETKPTAKPVLDQVDCVYVPHVSGKVAGQTMEIFNSDNTMHNVHATPSVNREFNTATGPGAKITRTFDRAEMGVEFKCDVHPWMKAYVHVMEHPFFAVSNMKGEYEIRGLPPGEYTITVNHTFTRIAPESSTVTFTIEGDETKEANFTYKVNR